MHAHAYTYHTACISGGAMDQQRLLEKLLLEDPGLLSILQSFQKIRFVRGSLESEPHGAGGYSGEYPQKQGAIVVDCSAVRSIIYSQDKALFKVPAAGVASVMMAGGGGGGLCCDVLR